MCVTDNSHQMFARDDNNDAVSRLSCLFNVQLQGVQSAAREGPHTPLTVDRHKKQGIFFENIYIQKYYKYICYIFLNMPHE